jgi:hypothetical protein
MDVRDTIVAAIESVEDCTQRLDSPLGGRISLPFRTPQGLFGVVLAAFGLVLATSCSLFGSPRRVVCSSEVCRGSVGKSCLVRDLCFHHARSFAFGVVRVRNYGRFCHNGIA